MVRKRNLCVLRRLWSAPSLPLLPSHRTPRSLRPQPEMLQRQRGDLPRRERRRLRKGSAFKVESSSSV
eukprot:952927-Rhodomonas_salina.1